jgi:hypothetical protein
MAEVEIVRATQLMPDEDFRAFYGEHFAEVSGGVTCVAEATSRLRATALVAEAEDSWVPFKLVDHTVFAVDSGKVVAISPPAACFG